MAGWFSVPDWDGAPNSSKSQTVGAASKKTPAKSPANKAKQTKSSVAVKSKASNVSKSTSAAPSSSSVGQFVRAPCAASPVQAPKRKLIVPTVSAKQAKKAEAQQNAAKKRKLDANVEPSSSTQSKKTDHKVKNNNAAATNASKSKKPTTNAQNPDDNPFKNANDQVKKTPKKKPVKPAKKLQLADEESDSELAAEVNSFRKKLLQGFTGAREIGGKPDPNATFSDDDDLSESDEEDSGQSRKRKIATKQIVEDASKKPATPKKTTAIADACEDDDQPQPAAPATGDSSFRDKLIGNLKGSRFRFINEQLYSSDGQSAVKLFKADRGAFTAYHEGYRQQVTQWPLNPLDRIIKSIKKLPKTQVIADFGCGEGRLAKAVPNKTYSLDLVAQRHEIIACDMAKTPLETGSIDVAVYCLSLMGTNLRDFILEANRVLRNG